jgi:hypothetical protein
MFVSTSVLNTANVAVYPLTDAPSIKYHWLHAFAYQSLIVNHHLLILDRELRIYITGSPDLHALILFSPIITSFMKSDIWCVILYDVPSEQFTNSFDDNFENPPQISAA